MVDHDIGEAGLGQRFQVILDQTLAAGLHQWLGRVQGEWAHPLALAGGQDHRLHTLASAGWRRLASNSPNSLNSGRSASTASI